MSLFNKMSNTKNSYGTTPGNGHPKSDDKIMNAGPGHVVPGENVHLAKRLVADMGYDPESQVDMNQGKGDGADIRISSKEFFLNKDQVDQLNEKGVNPEVLSPNSQYNKTGNNMKTGGPNAYKSGGGLSLYELMMNNSNQYSPAYQDAGSTDPVQPAAQKPDLSVYPYHTRNNDGMKWFDDRGNMVYYEGPQGETLDYTTMTQDDWNAMEGYSPGLDVNNPPPGSFQVTGKLPTRSSAETLQDNQSVIPGSSNQSASTPGIVDDSMTPKTMFQQDLDGSGIPDYLEPGNPNSMGENNQPVIAPNPNLTTSPDLEKTQPGISPEEQHINDLLESNRKSGNKEVLANLAMFGWNMSRERQPGEAPQMVNAREMVRDYEGMKGKATADLERGERRNAYMMKNLGATDKIVGLHANTVAGTNQITQSIFDMQGQDSMRNIATANQAKSDYENAMRQFRMNEAISSQNFKDAKGKNMAENVAQVFDVRENQLNNEATLKGYKVNQDMNELDRQYNTLNKSAIGNSNYFSRQDWYKMTPEERSKWQKISEEKSKPKITK